MSSLGVNLEESCWTVIARPHTLKAEPYTLNADSQTLSETVQSRSVCQLGQSHPLSTSAAHAHADRNQCLSVRVPLWFRYIQTTMQSLSHRQ